MTSGEPRHWFEAAGFRLATYVCLGVSAGAALMAAAMGQVVHASVFGAFVAGAGLLVWALHAEPSFYLFVLALANAMSDLSFDALGALAAMAILAMAVRRGERLFREAR